MTTTEILSELAANIADAEIYKYAFKADAGFLFYNNQCGLEIIAGLLLFGENDLDTMIELKSVAVVDLDIKLDDHPLSADATDSDIEKVERAILALEPSLIKVLL